MDIVDELLESEKKETEIGDEPINDRRFRKKRKIEKEILQDTTEQNQTQFTQDHDMDDKERMERRELKILLKKHKDMNFDELMKHHHFVHSLKKDDMKELLENIKLEVGLSSPAQNAKNILIVISGLMKLMTGKDYSERLTSDTELLAAIEHYLPDPFNGLSIPLQFFSRIGYHILNSSVFNNDLQ